ncbi:ABC transporter permease [Leucobacter weissii]|uniref:ABC transporter permease n=1 Tax=Leucobacter weissii TaxID=1983706 RepID=A0A939S5X1_9MICO|nr:ABC transporter permease [Leucobacter weissii]MBO1901764.1 ABC transporter permease [Leucobacter weissii]
MTTTSNTIPLPDEAPGSALAARLADLGERFGLLILVALVWAMFALLPSSSAAFTSAANLQVILANLPVVTIVAIAAIFPLICGHFDFSVGATAVLSSIVCAAAQSHFQLPLPLAIAAGVLAGAVVGVLNAALVAGLHLNAFVVTIGMATLVPGVVHWYTGGVDITSNIAQPLREFGSQQWLGLPRSIWLLLGVAVVCWYLLTQTPFGRRSYAVGINAAAAKLVGIRVDRVAFASFLLSGALAGLAGIVLTARNGGGLVGDGTDLLFPALTAVFLGATAITPGRYNVIGVVIGVLFVAVSVSGLRLSGAADWLPAVFNGTALIAAIALSTALSRRRMNTPGRRAAARDRKRTAASSVGDGNRVKEMSR